MKTEQVKQSTNSRLSLEDFKINAISDKSEIEKIQGGNYLLDLGT